MSKYVLLVETGSDMPADLAKKYGIGYVPMHVSFGDRTLDDGAFPVEDIYKFFESTGTLTKTSGCTPGDFDVAYDEIRRQHPDSHIVHLAYSAITTCSYQSAIIAAEGRENITSIDTKHVSAGQSMVTLQLARWLEKNPEATIDEINAQVEQLRVKCRMGFFPGDLAYLRAGGRVSNAAYLGAKILSLNPLIEVLDGLLKATKKYRGRMEKVAPKFMQEYIEENNIDRSVLMLVRSSGLSEKIMADCTELAKQRGFEEIIWVQTGGVVTTHCGPGGFGVCGMSRN